MKLISC